MKKLFYTLAAGFISAASFAQPCSDLFFSEYIEGSSNNKSIEIYNPTSGPISLTGYEVRNFNNGNATATGNFALPLTGSLASGDVLVISNGSASAAILAVTDIIPPASGSPGAFVAGFNGDDALGLYKNNVLIDVIGVIGVDPGTEWAYSGGFSTLNKTLVRKQAIQQGITTWDSTTALANWNVFAIDVISNLGSHSMTPCGPVTDTLVRFNNATATVAENVGSTNIAISYSPVSATSAFSASLVLKSGNAANIANFTTQTINFAAGVATASAPISVTNNALIDGNKTFVFALRNPSGVLELGNDSLFTLTVTDDDAPVSTLPVYTIARVRGSNTGGQPDSLGTECELRGTVYGVNLRTGGLEFTIHDGTAGIGVFAPATASNFGYTVNEGDSIHVRGEIVVYSGLGQIAFLDTLIVVGQGTLKTPTFVTTLSENTESDLIRIANVHLVNPSQWTGAANGFNVDITNGSQTFKMRVHPNTTLFGTSAPVGNFDVMGIGGQFLGTTAVAPFVGQYQIIPRRKEDILLGGSISENEASSKLSVFPNPTQGRFFVNFESASTDVANISLKDLTGRTISVKNVNMVSGNNQIEINENLSAGIYLVSIEMGSVKAVKRVIVK
jgi:hypothetical protein